MYKQKPLENINPIKLILWLLISIGCFFIIAQFLQDRGMWMDEAELVTNIINSSFSELFKPFKNGQVAPILYLIFQKGLSGLFGNSDLTFRILPLFATFTSSFLLYSILKKLGVNKLITLLGIALFLNHPHIIYYSSEVKQYPIDVFAALSLIFIGLKIINQDEMSKKIWFALLAVPLFFISNITIIILVPTGLLLLLNDFKFHKKIKVSTIIVLLICSLSFVAYYFLFINNHSNKSLMLSYWMGKGVPGKDVNSIIEIFTWSSKRVVKELFLRLLSYENFYVFSLSLISFLYCLFLLVKEKKVKIITITLIPVFIHVLLAVLSLYPFWRRLILYMLPLYIIVLCAGFEILNSCYSKKRMLIYSLKIVASIYFIFNVFSNLRKFPMQHDTYKLAINYLNQEDYNDENILIFGGKSGLSYYKELSNPYKDKIETIGNTRPYEELIEELRTKDISNDHWLIFSYRIEEWKSAVLPILEEKGDIEFIKGKKTFLGQTNGYLYKYTPYKRNENKNSN
jgi:4-amino-4-deoxy-L-arabinose transferase-like glycosyltransferase